MGEQNNYDPRALFADSKPQELPAGATILREHDPASSVFLIERGELILERTTSRGERQITNILFPGYIVGHSNDENYHYSVQTITAATVRELPSKVFVDAMTSSTDALDDQMRALGNILLAQVDHLFILAKKKAHERLCYFLCELNDKQKNGRGKTVNINMSRQDIADYLGLTSESVTRGFARLKKDGLIEFDNPHEIELLQPEQIRALSDS